MTKEKAEVETRELEVSVDDLIRESGITRATLELILQRVVRFIQTIVTNATVRAQMRERGLTAKEINRAVDAIRTASQVPEEPVVVSDDAIRAAYTYVDSHDEEVHKILRAGLQFNYPVQFKFLTDGIGPAQGIMAVINMRTLLERWDEMLGGASRKATRESDRAALALVTERGLSKELMASLRAHVKTVGDLQPDAEPLNDEQFELRRVRALLELRKWHFEWSEIAKVAIKRRDHLISLGLASRREGAAADEPEAEDLGGPTD